MSRLVSGEVVTTPLAGGSTLGQETTYDAYGNPRQTVDPGTAAAGVAAAGVLGYALAKDRDRDRHHHYYHDRRKHYRHHGYYDRRGRYYRY